MKKGFLFIPFFIICVTINLVTQAQTIPNDSTATTSSKPVISKETEKQVNESLSKAAKAAEKAAERLSTVMEKKANHVLKESKPYLESFLTATADLLEKLAVEIENAVNEKEPKKK